MISPIGETGYEIPPRSVTQSLQTLEKKRGWLSRVSVIFPRFARGTWITHKVLEKYRVTAEEIEPRVFFETKLPRIRLFPDFMEN